MVCLGKQSQDIAQGVDEGDGLHKEQGAGDQGMMFGYASEETKDYVNMSIAFSHGLVQTLADIRKKSTQFNALFKTRCQKSSNCGIWQ